MSAAGPPPRAGTPAGPRHGLRADRPIPTQPATVDLHTHSRRSDGVLEPGALVADAAAAGVRLLALTDHDTLAGVREVAPHVPPGLTLVPGVEINCIVPADAGHWEGELHVLGLGVDPADEAFEQALARQREARRTRFSRILARLRDLDMPIDDEIKAAAWTDDDALGRPTVARALIARGHATSVEDAFRRLLGHGMPAWVPRDGLGPVEAIGAIRAAGGLPVLAHFSEAAERQSVVRDLITVGLGGLEVHYLAWSAETVEQVGQVADALGLVRTGGTDYHGDLGPYGEAIAALSIPDGVGERVRSRLAGA
ncbi:MAG TPA: PHP domain-containing protein [Candidatus Limnocylindrales bacterium]|nr:PHP domain-containing protein [Candidatus Limnocylindrales bacterium]